MAASETTDQQKTAERTPIQAVALVVGAVFLVVGGLGFVPGVTANYDQMTFAGHHSGALLLGLFAVSVLHNIVHLVFGVAGVLSARKFSTSRAYLVLGGAIYAVLWLYGVVVPAEDTVNFVPINAADNWLHLGLAIVMLAAGILLGRNREGGAPSVTGAGNAPPQPIN